MSCGTGGGPQPCPDTSVRPVAYREPVKITVHYLLHDTVKIAHIDGPHLRTQTFGDGRLIVWVYNHADDEVPAQTHEYRPYFRYLLDRGEASAV